MKNRDDYVHNCYSGLATVTSPVPTSGLTVQHSVFQDLNNDGVDIGHVTDESFDHDIIRGMSEPGATIQHDGIQFYGENSHIMITNDVIANSHDQLPLLQDAIAAPGQSPVNTDVVVDNDLLYGAGSYAVQVQGTQQVTFDHDTM